MTNLDNHLMNYLENNIVILSLGSHLGDRISNIKAAVELLLDSKIIINPIISSYYQTEPYGVKEQNAFINIAIKAETYFSPNEFLFLCKSIEYLLNRKKRQHWGEREIDIDIIFYGNEVIKTDLLIIPHKEMHKRNFVLVPLKEICPDYIHPVLFKSIDELASECEDEGEVERVDISYFEI